MHDPRDRATDTPAAGPVPGGFASMTFWTRRTIWRVATVALMLPLWMQVARAADTPLLVFAPASLQTALAEVLATFPGDVRVSYAGSSTLARQVAAGAPADVVISASAAWMDWLESGGHIRAESRTDLLTNQLVVVAPQGSAAPLNLAEADAFTDRLAGGRIAMALVEAVPAGIYGRQALESLGHWQLLAPQIAESDNVRMALSLVALGAAPLGIVYATDASAEPRIAIVADIPASLHDPIVYPVALTAQSESDPAASLLTHLTGPLALGIFASHGFAAAE